MREIKFRVWNKEKKKMYFATLEELENSCFRCAEDLIPEDFKEEVRLSDFKNTKNPRLQFTGLKDKNGKEIYEGDIIRYNHKNDHPEGIPMEVKIQEFLESGSYDDIENIYVGVCATQPYKNCLQNIYGLSKSETTYCEVIGNIYENPELLEKKEAK